MLYLSNGDTDEGNIQLRKQVHSLVNLSKKNGTAWQGETLALACSSEIDIRYFLTEGWAAGLPGDKRDQSLVQPMELRIARSFPIVLLTVPAASLVGQQHFRLEWEPKLGQLGEWILVFPLESFHTRNLMTPLREAEMGDLGVGREDKKDSSSKCRLHFCFS